MSGVGGRKSKRGDYHVTLVDDAIIQAVCQLHFLTAEQLTRLLYAPSSINHCREQLKRLVDHGYLLTIPSPRAGSQGRSKYVYTWGQPALAYLRSLRKTVPERVRSSELPRGDRYLLHTLAINDVLIASRLLERHVPHVSVFAIKHERELKRSVAQTMEIQPGKGRAKEESVYVVPDGWIEFRVKTGMGKTRQNPIWLEVDRASEAVSDFKKKLRGIIAYYDAGHYERHFGTKHVKIVVAIDTQLQELRVAPEDRLLQTLRWCEEELKDLGKMSWARAMDFGLLPRGDELSSRTFFLSPHFFQPFLESPVSLLDLPQRDSLYRDSGLSKPLVP